jgi:hypothetical protein
MPLGVCLGLRRSLHCKLRLPSGSQWYRRLNGHRYANTQSFAAYLRQDGSIFLRLMGKKKILQIRLKYLNNFFEIIHEWFLGILLMRQMLGRKIPSR